MLTNYFKVACRVLVKQKLHVFVNLIGLTIGLTISFLIALFIEDEISYDEHHEGKANIYRIAVKLPDMALGKEGSAIVSGVFKDFLPEQFPEKIIKTTQIGYAAGWMSLRKGNEELKQIALHWADEDLNDFFKLKMLVGDDPRLLLSRPNNLLISKKLAFELFGGLDIIGRTLKLGDEEQMVVAGVFENLPHYTHLKFDVLGSMSTYKRINPDLFQSWTNIEFYSYIKIKNGVNVKELEKEINQIWSSRNKRFKVEVILQPLVDIYLNSDYMWEMKKNGNIDIVNMSAVLMIVVLMVACFNFINMSTARAPLRAKEVGIRKCLGATKKDIIIQFISESLILVFISAVASVFLAGLLIPFFNEISGKQISIVYDFQYLLKLFLLSLLVGLLAGSYPAFFISSYNTLKVLSGDLHRGRGSLFFRKLLVIMQCSVAVMLIIMSTVVYLQIEHGYSFDSGYDKKDVILVKNLPDRIFSHNFDSLRAKLEKNNDIRRVTSSTHVPTTNFSSVNSISIDGRAINSLARVPRIGVRYGYLEALGVQVLAGRNFSQKFTSDWVHDISDDSFGAGVIITESIARAAGWKNINDAIGSSWNWSNYKGVIIGVIEDMHFLSLKDATPLFFITLGQFGYPEILIVKTNGDDIRNAMNFVESVLKEAYQIYYYKASLLEDEVTKLYSIELKQKSLLIIFTIISMFITFLGLIGLTVFVSEGRKKEMAIRKVLGADRNQLINMLVKEFLLLGGIACIIAWPIIYWAASYWLESFLVRIDLNAFIFLGAGLIVLAMILFTVTLLVYRASAVRPIFALRYE